jgi:tricorn protease
VRYERYPAWSPNNRWLAYWSDESGEWEIHLRDNAASTARKLTSFGKGMGWNLFWSPDSKKIAFINDLQEIKVLTVASGELSTIDKTTSLTYSALQGFDVSWSPTANGWRMQKAAATPTMPFISTASTIKKVYKATSGYYNDSNPVFDPTGKYIFFTTDRSFTPSYSNFDNTWIYPNSTQLAVTTLDAPPLHCCMQKR